MRSSGAVLLSIMVAILGIAGLAQAAAIDFSTWDAAQTNTLKYEGTPSTVGNDNQVDYFTQTWSRDGSLCCAGLTADESVVTDNSQYLGVPIELIGKLDGQSGSCGADCVANFDGTDFAVLITDVNHALGAGILLGIDFSDANLGADWQIVKLALKQAQWQIGLFVAEKGTLHDPTNEPVQWAFIPKAEFDSFIANAACQAKNPPNGCPTGLGVSHFTAFGTPTTQVPEPGTITLLGLGLVGLGATARRRFGR